MILSDIDINWRCGSDKKTSLIHPFNSERVQPSSVDLTLGTKFIQYYPTQFGRKQFIDLADIQGTGGGEHETLEQDNFFLHAHGFCLGQTAEWVNIPTDLVGQVEGKSSLARLGLIVHVTSGFCDPGFQGVVTLEFFNCNDRPIILRSGLPICQIVFTKLLNKVARPYGSEGLGSHYQQQAETTASKLA